MTHVLYNPQACGGMGEKNAREMAEKLNLTEADFQDIVTLTLARYLDEMPAEEQVIVAGGDGTLNHFVNRLEGRLPALPVYYYPAGSGNDFMHDVQERAENGLVLLNPFLEGLPGVTVAGRTRLFLNGVGFALTAIAVRKATGCGRRAGKRSTMRPLPSAGCWDASGRCGRR